VSAQDSSEWVWALSTCIVVQVDCELGAAIDESMVCGQSIGRATYVVVYGSISYTAYVLDEGSDFAGTSKEAYRLVDEMGTEIIGEAIARQGFVLPSSFQCFTVTVEASIAFVTSTHSRENMGTYWDSNSVITPRDWEELSGCASSFLRARKSLSQRLF
jgi:hypothetical protein